MNIKKKSKFGRWTVLQEIASAREKPKRLGLQGKLRRRYLCECDCGIHKEILRDSLLRGKSRSCGCLHRDELRTRVQTHSLTKTPIHRIWGSMKQRCLNTEDKGYPRYGGRGIGVCERWLSFKNFYKDMGDCPRGLSLDRIDNEGDYTPENCRWATRKEQSRNTRRNVNITYKGKTQCITAWAKELGINKSTLSSRLQRGWSVEKSFTKSKLK